MFHFQSLWLSAQSEMNPLTYSHYDCAGGNAIYEKKFEVHQACSSDEDDFNTIHSCLKKTAVIRYI